jgi:hypothetical protein
MLRSADGSRFDRIGGDPRRAGATRTTVPDRGSHVGYGRLAAPGAAADDAAPLRAIVAGSVPFVVDLEHERGMSLEVWRAAARRAARTSASSSRSP